MCVPVFNGERYLAETLESVLRQDFASFELVICDDASTDLTPDICGRYAGPRVRYRRFEQRGGQSGNFNRCLAEARGDFVTLLHSDDVHLPGLLARRVEQLERHPEAGFACGALELADAAGGHLSLMQPWKEERLLPSDTLVRALLHGSVVSTLGLLVRRENALLFRNELTWGHDWDWVLRLAARHPAHYDSRPLARYRVHNASGTAEILDSGTNAQQERSILDEALARVPDGERDKLRESALRALSLRQMAFAGRGLEGNRRGVARYNLKHAALAWPVVVFKPAYWAMAAASLGPLWVYSLFRKFRKRLRDPPPPQEPGR